MHKEICYKKSFLNEVVVRVDFFTPIPELENSLPTKLADTLSKSFQIMEPTESIGHQLQINPEGSANATEIKLKHWNFYGIDRKKLLSISPNFVFISYKNYQTYEVIKDEFSQTIESISREFSGVKSGRFGLRYINNIEIPALNDQPLKFNSYISEELISPITFFKDKDSFLNRVFHIVEIKEEDLITRFQYGYPNPDYPAPIKKPYFVLDLDSSVEIAHDLAESIRYMDSAHSTIQNIFEKSITDDLRKMMNDD